MAVSNSGSGMDEMLLRAVIDGTLKMRQDLLTSVPHIGVERQQNLLQVAVRVGIVDSVVQLLELGVDPTVRDGKDSTAREVAERLAQRFPEDENWKAIASMFSAYGNERTTQINLNGSALDDEAVSRLSERVALLDESMKRLTQEGKEQKDALARHHFGMKEAMQELKTSTVSSVDDVKVGLSIRDVKLKKLEEKLNQLVEENHPISKFLNAIRAKAISSVGGPTSVRNMRIGDVLGGGADEAEVRKNCVVELMSRTEFFQRTGEHVKTVKDFYETLLRLSPMTSCILRYMQNAQGVQVVVDCSSYYIGDMKKSFVDLAGRRCDGGKHYTYVDLGGKIVYLGGQVNPFWKSNRVIGHFVMALARLSFHLAFENDGRPYRADDWVLRAQYGSALGNIDKDWLVEDKPFDALVKKWASSDVLLEKQVCLMSAVPGMVATFGVDGVLRARRKLRHLTQFYEDHVMPVLMAKVESIEGSG